ncbi:MAG TPA: type II toxin-antitoxin system VapC family toxin [Anaerolineales bacterium]|nr:type II toxin-antitoxin system VapC family toxin [Anaerolineales bacterium]HMR98517.1 type II toxin-antitoxin system VapC family toxin [Anaerolineales bacterium]HNQ93328.1 type II toxin-antitoxin system VapC family toxin [Anaerolineales bacterium]HNS62486.1 type II toxin-antitoxin system VapC family toxin [Anaerolineales bacterium]
MNILLDTHAFLWFVDDNPRLSQPARVLIESGESQPFLSVASLWEIAIKISLGKLFLNQAYETFIPHHLALNGIELLNISLDHTSAVTVLPFHHRDPFDRLLVVQSNIENMTFVSADPVFDAYGVKRVW